MTALQPEKELLEQFKKEMARASQFYLGMALVTKGGLKLVLPSMERCLKMRGRGQVLFGVDLPTDPDAIQSLKALESRHKQNFEVRLFQSGTRFFHPKVSVFVRSDGKKTAIVGSSNLTEGGLGTNYETNLLVDDRRIVQVFRVERLSGKVAKSIGSAECLVHAEILGGRKTTRKLVKARQMNIPIITEEQFLALMRSSA
jgi:HKD family nuclease